jgi:hypothetical protein
MRWINKPRKKTRREVVLEYIKFLKIMGYYPNVVAYMYRLSRMPYAHVTLPNRFGTLSVHESNVLSHNECMIKYFEAQLHYARELNKWRVKEQFVDYPLHLPYSKSCDMLNLLWSYFEEKHIANCILVD